MKTYKDYIFEDADPRAYLALFKSYGALFVKDGYLIPMAGKAEGERCWFEIVEKTIKDHFGFDMNVFEVGTVLVKDGSHYTEYYHKRGEICGTKVLMDKTDNRTLDCLKMLLKFLTGKAVEPDDKFLRQVEKIVKPAELK